MQLNPQVVMVVRGYTDDVGDEQANLALSQARAQAVADWIAAKGIDPGRFRIEAHGEADPVGDNATPEGKALNRRIEVELLNLLACPATRQPLALLEGAGLEALNHAIAAGGVRRIDGSPQREPLREALVTRDRALAYRVDDGIPVLLHRANDHGIESRVDLAPGEYARHFKHPTRQLAGEHVVKHHPQSIQVGAAVQLDAMIAPSGAR